MKLSYLNKREFTKKIDALPPSPKFTEVIFSVTGDLLDANNQPQVEQVSLWMRDPMECIQELLGNPSFRNETVFAPCRIYTDSTQTTRMYGEMWTGDWWWALQVFMTLFFCICCD